MPIGIIINAAAIFLGGIVGGFFSEIFSPKIKQELNLIFGLCSLAMGIYAIAPMKNLPAVIFATVIGTLLGFLLHFGDWLQKGAAFMQRPVQMLFPNESSTLSEQAFLSQLVTIIVLFCASGTGIYGSLEAGMTGDHSVLIAKSILDFFTAFIFATHLGFVVSVIALPQFILFYALFILARFILPLTTPAMILDFKAVGGLLMVATGFRIMEVKRFPTADMIPAMLVIFPISWGWTHWLLPFFH